ncbi:MAG TPA: AAA family ATPase [Tepidisphaeraceae bacterium]|nr:AAA family ATPase [Tepidisphaeraceae bacterium]
MNAIIFCGIQGAGKSTFFRERFFDTHIRINMDMLRTRYREDLLLRACIEGKQPFVVDNTNPTAEERGKYIVPAKAAGFRVIGYYFSCKPADALSRNEARAGKSCVPRAALLGTYTRMQIPSMREGFDELWYVRCEGSTFVVNAWREDVPEKESGAPVSALSARVLP